MKSKFLSLVALLVLSALPAVAQFTSSPLEPGLFDYYRGRHVINVQLLNPKKMMVGNTTIEWVASDQITVSRDVADLRGMSSAERDGIMRRISDYNTSAPVGTLVLVENDKVTMIHNLNPKQATPERIEHAVASFSAAADTLKEELRAPAVEEAPLRFIN